MKTQIYFISLLIIAALTSCGSNISKSMSPPVIVAPVKMADLGKGAMVFIEEIRDERGQSDLGHSPNGPITSIGSVPSTVRQGLEDLFKKSGFSVTDSAPVVLQSSLQQWDVDITGRMSSVIVSNAKLTIQVYDPANRLAYTGKYQGNAQIQQSSSDDKIVKEAMSGSMNQVLEQIAADKTLMKLLATF